jgi:hypothetical protein
LNPLQIENTVGETMTLIPKGAFKKDSHNPNVRDAQNYSVVEDLAQTPCAMSSLEVLQSFPSQRKYLLSTLGATETSSQERSVFDPTDLKTSSSSPCRLSDSSGIHHEIIDIETFSIWWLMRVPRLA